MKKLLIVDTFNFLHRAYHALPLTLTDSSGEPTNAVYGVTSMLINLFNQLRPNYVIAAFDSKEPTHRVTAFTGYKAMRKPMEESLAVQIPKVEEVLAAFGIKQVQVSGYEADDIIGTLAVANKHKADVLIVSNDRDLWQLVDDHVLVMLPNIQTKGFDMIGPREVKGRLGLEPSQVPDYKGLRGDPSDNIPGVFGIGEKTAQKLIEEFGSVANVYKQIDKVEPTTLREKLLNSYETALMSRNLAQIVLDVPVAVDLEDCAYNEFNRSKVKTVLEKYNFKSLIKRLGFEATKNKSSEISKNQLSLM